MNTPPLKSLGLLIALTLPTLHVSADTLASYVFTSGSLVSNDANSDSTASSFSAGAGLAGVTTSYTSGWAQVGGDQLVQSQGTLTDLGTAITNNDYFTFTVAPSEGFQLNLTSLTLGVAAYRASAASTSVKASFYALSSVNGFTTANLINSIQTTQQNAPFTFDTLNVDLSSIGYQSVTAPVEFRIYMVMNTSGTTRYTAIDNITLTGTLTTSSVPEPSSYALLLGAALLGICAVRRHSRPARS